MNVRDVTMKYERLIVFILHDFAEKWGFKFGLKLFIGTLEIMANTGVFVRGVYAIKRSIKNFPYPPRMILI
jgi:hypothetical protein